MSEGNVRRRSPASKVLEAGTRNTLRREEVAGQHGQRWHRAAARLAATGLPITAYIVGRGLSDPDGELTGRYGLDLAAAVLVRPGGYLAWRVPRLARRGSAGVTGGHPPREVRQHDDTVCGTLCA